MSLAVSVSLSESNVDPRSSEAENRNARGELRSSSSTLPVSFMRPKLPDLQDSSR